MAIRGAVKTGILLAQSSLIEPHQKKQSQQHSGQAKKPDLPIFHLQELLEHFTPFGG
jgi:hypothetical protein